MTALWRLVSVIEHPATKFVSHAVLALGGLLEMVDTPFEVNRALCRPVTERHP